MSRKRENFEKNRNGANAGLNENTERVGKNENSLNTGSSVETEVANKNLTNSGFYGETVNPAVSEGNFPKLDKNAFEHVGKNIEHSMSIARPSISYAQDAWRRFRQNRVALAGLIFVLIMVLGSIFVPLLSPMPIDQQNLEYTYVKPMTYAPDLNHMFIFGTDNLGRDLWVRTWYGARISLSIGILAALISVLIGVPYGGISGYSRGTVDIIMMRIVEIVSGIPYMILVILFLVVLPRGYLTIVAAMSIVIWTSPARLVRAQVLQLKGQEFILAAKTLGASTGRIISKHLIPNSLGVVVIQMTMTIPSAIFSEAFLSYIGIGIQPPMASWGTLARDGVQIFQLNPWVMFIPATFICLTMLSLNLIGDALRNALDPKLRR